MPRPKGLPKTGGRKKGTPNKPKLPVSRAVPGNVVVVTTHEALGKLGGSQSEAWNDAIALQVVNALWLKDPAARHKGIVSVTELCRTSTGHCGARTQPPRCHAPRQSRVVASMTSPRISASLARSRKR
jgi:hypothetical protein